MSAPCLWKEGDTSPISNKSKKEIVPNFYNSKSDDGSVIS